MHFFIQEKATENILEMATFYPEGDELTHLI